MTHEELPHGWTITTTGDLFEFVSSGSRGWAKYYSDRGAKFIRIGNLDHGTIDLDLREVQHVNLPDVAEGTRTRLREGDLLISITAELGMVAIVPGQFGEAYVNQHVALARPRPAVEPRFIAWFLASDADGKKQLLELRRGATKVGLGLDDIRQVQVALPPLAEQRRIVDKIETLTARSRRAKEALDAIPALLARFRKAVLAAAFRGDLTADWREKNPDVEPAEELLKRIRAERRRRWEEAELAKMRAKGKVPGDDRWKAKYEEPAPVDASELPELPEGWCWATVEELATKVVDGVHKKPNYVEAGIPFLTVKNLTAGPGISFDDASYVSLADHEEFIRRTYPEMGDILISKDGTLGVPRLVRTERVFSIFVSLALVKPVIRTMGDYLELAFLSPYFQERFKRTGSGLQHIHLTDLRAAALPIAPTTEQEEISRRCRRITAKFESLETRYIDVLGWLGRMDQAILAKAFRGELVPQDPNDEPASVLLERLRAERALNGKPTNGAGRRRAAASPPPAPSDPAGRTAKPQASRRGQAPARSRG